MSIATRSISTPQPEASPEPSLARRSRLRAILPLPSGKALGVLVLAILVLLTAISLIELPILHHSNGNILFPLDSAYINITVGRNLAFYQVWGVSKYAFQSAASSLLYPLALAPFFFIFGAHLVIPLVVNFLAAAYFLLMLQRTLIRYGVGPARQLLTLIAATALTLLPLLVVSGMEYTLQLLFVFLFMDALVQTLSAAGSSASRASAAGASAPKASAPRTNAPGAKSAPLYTFALLAVAVRYEDFLIIALASLLLSLHKGWKPAIKLAAIAAAPIIVFGVISLIKKNYFLPNSMLVGPYPTWSLILAALATGVAAWLIIGYSAAVLRQKPRPQASAAQKPTPPANAQRSQPAPEAHAPRPARANRTPAFVIPGIAILALLIIPFTTRNAANLAHFQRDCNKIYDEQYPTAHFVHLYYNRQTIGTNTPGAISYFSEGRKLDFTGVASNDVVRFTNEHGWAPLYADSLSKKDGIRVAIVADPWFRAEQLPRWTKIATWDLADQHNINFYVVEKYDTTWLRRRLHEYEPLLPAGVSVKYYP